MHYLTWVTKTPYSEILIVGLIHCSENMLAFPVFHLRLPDCLSFIPALFRGFYNLTECSKYVFQLRQDVADNLE